MKIAAALLCLALCVGLMVQAQSRRTPPQEPQKSATAQADAFYRTYLKLKVSGLPSDEQMKELSPFFTQDLLELFAAARQKHDRFVREHPDEKPPWGDGDLFTSLFEGAGEFKLGKPALKGSRAEIPVKLAYHGGGSTSRWTDVLVLTKTANGWRVSDILLKGEWQFKSGDSLRNILKSE